MTAPVGAATWSAWGSYEPDTARDRTDGFMRDAPNLNAGARPLYFNGFAREYGQLNPNTALTGSHILVAGSRIYAAMLGAWTDCNRDGYVGMAETVVVSYRSTLLLGDPTCPVGSDHNDGNWVHEYIPVGWQHGEVNFDPHPVQVLDQQARVWADFGLPGDVAAKTCPITPFPHGTTAGTGWMLRYGDCYTGKRVANTVNEADPNDALGLRFDDPNNPQYSDSLLNQQLPQSLFGNPATGETGTLQLDSEEDGGEEEAAFTMWDCSDRALIVRDPTGSTLPRAIVIEDGGAVSGGYGKIDENLTDEDGAYAWFAKPAPALHDPTTSVADGLNETFRGFRIGGGDENYDDTVGGDCDTEGDDADGDNTYSDLHQLAFFYADGNHEGGTQFAGKRGQDVRFTYGNGAKPQGALADVSGPTHPVNAGLLQSSAGWAANVNYVTVPQSIDRNTLEVQGGLYVTFYGRVGPSTLAAGYAPRGATGSYGSEACGTNAEGIHGGWYCDPDAWYLDSNGNDIGTVWDVRVGTNYQFRDIDCADGEVARDTGVYASLVYVSAYPPCAL